MVLLPAAAGLLLLVATADASPDVQADPLFASQATLDVEIEAPFGMIVDLRPNDEESPGKFRYKSDDGDFVELDIVVRTRGRARRTKEVCSFPPLRLNFRKSQVEGSLFDGQDKLKLVSHCRDEPAYAQAVVAEYIAYRIFNLLTRKSFRARLLKANYIYSDEGSNFEGFAILIEHEDRLEKRLDAKVSAVERARAADIEPADLNLAHVFQFFIGNTDFSPIATAPGEECCHNQALLRRKDGLHYTVPHDFDQSGLVDAPHALPNPRFRLRSPRQRLYRGFCANNPYLPETLSLFRERREAIESLVREQTELSPKTARSMLAFIGTFYEVIGNPRRVKKELVDACR